MSTNIKDEVILGSSDPKNKDIGLLIDQNNQPVWNSGSRFNSLSVSDASFDNPVYNGDSTLASATINNIDYVFTYSNGKLETVTGGGRTKTYTWSGDQLQSVVVS